MNKLISFLVTALAISAIAKRIVLANDLTILDEHGGYLSLSYDSGRNVLHSMEREKAENKNGDNLQSTCGPWTFERGKTMFSKKNQNSAINTQCAQRSDSQFKNTKPHYLTSVPQSIPSMTKGKRVFHCMIGKAEKKQIIGA